MTHLANESECVLYAAFIAILVALAIACLYNHRRRRHCRKGRRVEVVRCRGEPQGCGRGAGNY